MIKKAKRKIFKVSDIVPADYNPRNIRKKAMKGLQTSVGKFGYLQDVIVNVRDGKNVIVGGHKRLEAMGLDPLGEIECTVVDLDSKDEKALNVALNSRHISGEFDEKLLNDLLADISEHESFNDLNFDDLVLEFGFDKKRNSGKDDEVPPVHENTVIKVGDLIEMGDHRLLCGDSTDKEQVERLMGGKKADMVFTDPPYSIRYQSKMRTKTEQFKELKNDDVILDIAPIIEIYSKGWVFVWTSWKVQDKWINQLSSLGYPTNMVIWYKPGGGMGDLKKTFSTDYEVALVYHRGAELCGKRIGSVWKIGKDGATTYLHPTQKPVELTEEVIDKTTTKLNVVLDIFLGSGSTLIACEKTNRKCYGMELDEKYCQVIIQRWCDFTGIDKIKINGYDASWKKFIREK